MKIYQFFAKDIIRRRRRVLYSSIGVIIGISIFIAVLTVSLAGEEKINAELEKYGPNLLVMPAISNLDMSMGSLEIGRLSIGENYIDGGKIPRIREITDAAIREAIGIEEEGDIATIAPKLYETVTVNGATVMVVGIDPVEERYLKDWWIISDGKYIEDDHSAIVGYETASLLQLEVGDPIEIKGTEFLVTGILDETGSADDYQIFIPLNTAQTTFGKEDLVSTIEIRALCNACPVEMIADKLNPEIAGIRAVAVKQIANAEMGMVKKVHDLMMAFAGVTLLIGSFMVVNTMMASIHERTKDIGIMKAVGASRRQIMRIFVYEALVIGIIGGIAGYILGSLAAYITGPLLFDGVTISYAPEYFVPTLSLSLAVSTISAIYPASRASKIKIADSFREL